jgi:serine/threonine protein kinase
MDKKADTKVPKIIGNHYKVKERIGGGSFGEIYKGQHISTNEEVAIKFVNFRMQLN